MHRSFSLLAVVPLWCTALAQNGPVVPTGAMRNTLFNGQLAGLIALDSIAQPGMYGIGPLEYLRGELLLWDGTVFVSEQEKNLGMHVVQRTEVRAPFFVHQRVAQWTAVALPDSVVDLPALDAFLTARYGTLATPFAFRLSGPMPSVDVHIVDVPRGAVVSGPEDAHRHNKHHHVEGRTLDLLGFFSMHHHRVFTHHDMNIHVHAITTERDWMGHVEQLRLAPGSCRLWVAVGP